MLLFTTTFGMPEPGGEMLQAWPLLDFAAALPVGR
jgi:hypothetical protein